MRTVASCWLPSIWRSSWAGLLITVRSTPPSLAASSTFSIVIGHLPRQIGAAAISGGMTWVWKSMIMKTSLGRGGGPLGKQVSLEREWLAFRRRARHPCAGERRRLLKPAARRRQAPQIVVAPRRHVVAHGVVVNIDDLGRRQQKLDPVPVGITQI